MALLKVKNLKIGVGEKVILSNINFNVEKSQTYLMFGPNGSGKSTLIRTIMGDPTFKILKGRIIFDGKDITNLDIEDRAELGISMGFQHPPEIAGIKLKDLLKTCLGKTLKDEFSKEEIDVIDGFKFREFLNRDVSLGFSGGEMKRSEILQMIFLKPRLLLLDEPDSGVDVESLKLISREIQKYITSTRSSVLIITHRGEILNYINAQRACVLFNSTVYCYQEPKKIFESIKAKGYEGCINCQERILDERQ